MAAAEVFDPARGCIDQFPTRSAGSDRGKLRKGVANSCQFRRWAGAEWGARVPPVDAHNPCADADGTRTGESPMKTILAALIALAALASVAGGAAAGDARTFFDQQDRARF